MIKNCVIFSLIILEVFGGGVGAASAVELLAWDFPDRSSGEKSKEESPSQSPLPVQYPSADFDPILEPGMIVVLESVDDETGQVVSRVAVPVISDEVVSIPGLGALEIVGKKLSAAQEAIRKFTGEKFRAGLMMGNVQTVQVLGKVQKPGNYPGYMKMSYIIAEALDRSGGSNFRVHFFNGANRRTTTLRYEDIVKGKSNPLVPPGSILYFPPSAGALFGEMTEKQVNLAYLIIVTLGALGITAIVRN